MMNKADSPFNQSLSQESYSKKNVAAAFFYLYAIIFFLWGFLNEYSLTILVDATAEHHFTNYQTAAFLICILCAVVGRLVQKYSIPNLFCTSRFIYTQLVISTFIIPVLLLEMILAPFYDMPKKDVSIFMKDERLGWKLKPGINELYGGIPVRTNTIGLRGEEVALPKPVDKNRVLFLGDSVTFGLRIEDDTKTLPSQTCHILEEESGVSIDTVNAGVPGYNTYQEYIYLRDEGLALQPDLVVLCFVLNDVVNTYTQKKYGDYGADSPIAFLADSFVDQLLQQSSIVHAVQYWKSHFRTQYFSRKNAIYEELFSAQSLIDQSDQPDIKAAWDITQRYLISMRELLDTQNIPFLLTISPYRFQYKEPKGNSIPQEVLFSFANDQNIHYLDLLPHMLDFKEQVDDDPDTLFQDYCHLTELGLEICSRQIAQTIIERRMMGVINPNGD